MSDLLPPVPEFWRTMKHGDRVVLIATHTPGKWEPETLHGAHGTFDRIAPTHGYARVLFDGEVIYTLVHPESLQPE